MAGITHSHDGVHSHEILDGPGSFLGREMPIVEGRVWEDRAFTVGIGGYVFVFCICFTYLYIMSSFFSHSTQ